MFKTLIHTTVDTIQTSKKMFVDTFVKHETMAKSLNDFVDAQTDYTKQAIDVTIKTGTEVYNTISDKAFYTETLKAAQDAVTQIVSKKSK